MKSLEISDQLQSIASADDFADSSAKLTEAWSEAGVGVEAIDPILQFMEEHPGIRYGMPGPLVHFVEDYYSKGYEDKLIESVNRRPTMHTAWMLNRVINGTKEPAKRLLLVSVGCGLCGVPIQAAFASTGRSGK